METFSKRLKELRTELNLSTRQLAEKIGATHSSVTRWELGQSEITLGYLIKLANLFKVSLDYLAGLED